MNPSTRTWRIVHDPEEIHQLVERGGGLMCPAVVGGCGPSTNPEHAGKFWWTAKTIDGSPKLQGYSDSIDLARQEVERNAQ